MAEHDTIEQQLREMDFGPAPADLLNRITTVVPHLAQEKRVMQISRLQRFAAEWSYGLSLKIAALAIVAVMGVAMGHDGHAAGGGFGTLLFGDIGVEDMI